MAQKKGCYVFVTKASKGYRTWYVGKTIKQTLEKECFNSRNMNIYQNVLLKINGTPMIYFVIPDIFNENSISELEKYLTVKAAEKNKDIYNVQNSERPYKINGITHGRSDNNTKIFKSTIGI